MEKINIAELLRDCPQGMELDCTCADNVVFDKIIEYEQIKCVIGECHEPLILDKYGRLLHICCPKCVIFPKGKTTWKGFVPPIKFKDGDIVYIKATFDWVCIYKEDKNTKYIYKYAATCVSSDSTNITYDEVSLCSKKDILEMRIATKKERQKLFNAIKESGYEWDSENKILEKLTESKENVDDKVVMSGIYFNREDYADEVELHLNNYEIEIRDGKTYAIFKNQKTKTLKKLVKPNFKVGDTIKNKTDKWLGKRTIQSYVEGIGYFTTINDWVRIDDQDDWELVKESKFKIGDEIRKKDGIDYRLRTIESINNNYYIIKTPDWFDNCYITDKLPFNCQDEYELVHSNKFDINTLKPFESKVLVRDDNCYEWEADIFGRYSNGYITLGGGKWNQCIPYEGNEHLLGKTDDCDDFFKIWENEKDDNSIQCD